jgi:hypothetical protein
MEEDRAQRGLTESKGPRWRSSLPFQMGYCCAKPGVKCELVVKYKKEKNPKLNF